MVSNEKKDRASGSESAADADDNREVPSTDTEASTEHAKFDELATEELRVALRALDVDKAVVILKERQANPNSTDSCGETPLHMACRSSVDADGAVARLTEALLEAGANNSTATYSSIGGHTPLHMATKHGHVGAVKLLLAAGAKLDVLDSSGNSPLHYAAQFPQQPAKHTIAAMQVLLDAGHDVNTTVQQSQSTPLHRAVQGYNTGPEAAVDVMDFLLKAGARTTATDCKGLTPVHQAAKDGSIAALDMLLPYTTDMQIQALACSDFTPLHAAVQGRSSAIGKILQLLLDAGVHPNACKTPGRRQWTALHAAAQQGNVSAVRALLAGRADVNAVDHTGCSPLLAAVLSMPASTTGSTTAQVMQTAGSFLEFMQLLLGAGADSSTATTAGPTLGWTPLHEAVRQNNAHAIKLLLKAGANPNAAVSKGKVQGWTPVHDAASRGHIDILQLLLAAGADVSAAGKSGLTPLHVALHSTSTEQASTVRALIAAGAPVNAATCADACREGIRPLHQAVNAGNAAMVQVLLQAGADVEAPCCTAYQERPLHMAAQRGHTAIVEQLLAAGADMFALRAVPQNAAQQGHNDADDDDVDFSNHHNNWRRSKARSCRSALELAVYFGEADILRLLLAKVGHLNIPPLLPSPSAPGLLQLATSSGFHGTDAVLKELVYYMLGQQAKQAQSQQQLQLLKPDDAVKIMRLVRATDLDCSRTTAWDKVCMMLLCCACEERAAAAAAAKAATSSRASQPGLAFRALIHQAGVDDEYLDKVYLLAILRNWDWYSTLQEAPRRDLIDQEKGTLHSHAEVVQLLMLNAQVQPEVGQPDTVQEVQD